MKRWLSGFLAALALFSLTACGGMASPAGAPEGSRAGDAKIDLPTAEDPETPEPSGGMEEAEGSGNGEAPMEYTAEPGSDVSGPAGGESRPDLSEPAGAPPEDRTGNVSSDDQSAGTDALPENGSYTTKEDVALYIHTYGRLPDNFITKKEAQNLGWPGGDLEPYAPGMCIGGSRFGNYEGLLPEAKGRTYTECDIDTLGARSRGAKRIVFSNDGLIYYTGDHYESFELLYGDEDND